MAKSGNEKEYDIFRDSLLRYVGYTNEIGEAARPLIRPSLVHLSYAFATGYVFADAFHKTYTSYARKDPMKEYLKQGGDAFLWQILASVIIPGLTINRITVFTRILTRKAFPRKCPCKRPPVLRYMPTCVGLLSIPFIVHPIDNAVTYILDNSVRKLYNRGGTEQGTHNKKE